MKRPIATKDLSIAGVRSRLKWKTEIQYPDRSLTCDQGCIDLSYWSEMVLSMSGYSILQYRIIMNETIDVGNYSEQHNKVSSSSKSKSRVSLPGGYGILNYGIRSIGSLFDIVARQPTRRVGDSENVQSCLHVFVIFPLLIVSILLRQRYNGCSICMS